MEEIVTGSDARMVAASLRNSGEYVMRSFGFSMTLRIIANAPFFSGDIEADVTEMTEAATIRHLADLIDRPTCHMTAGEKGIGLKQWKCDRCGGLATAHERPRFCPNCGAEVVEDD